MARVEVFPDAEEFRDTRWGREGTQQGRELVRRRALRRARRLRRVHDRLAASGAVAYVAVCGRRDAVMPRNVQKDPEASHTWLLKDEVVRHGKVYYGKLAGARAMFIAPRMVRYFHAIWGVRRVEEPKCLSRNAQAILRVLRREWEIATSDLRDDSGIKDRATFTRALDELQAAMLVVPAEVYYQPTFTYIWTLCCVRETGEGGGDRRDGRLRTGVLLANAAYCLLSLPRLRRRTCRRACNGRSSGTRTSTLVLAARRLRADVPVRPHERKAQEPDRHLRRHGDARRPHRSPPAADMVRGGSAGEWAGAKCEEGRTSRTGAPRHPVTPVLPEDRPPRHRRIDFVIFLGILEPATRLERVTC